MSVVRRGVVQGQREKLSRGLCLPRGKVEDANGVCQDAGDGDVLAQGSAKRKT